MAFIDCTMTKKDIVRVDFKGTDLEAIRMLASIARVLSKETGIILPTLLFMASGDLYIDELQKLKEGKQSDSTPSRQTPRTG